MSENNITLMQTCFLSTSRRNLRRDILSLFQKTAIAEINVKAAKAGVEMVGR